MPTQEANMQGATLDTPEQTPAITPHALQLPGWAAALIVFGLTCLMAALVLPGVRGRAIYGDELRTWRESIKPSYHSILTWRNTRDHAPMSYLLVKLTSDLTGMNRGWTMRLPSVICGLLCIPAAFFLGRAVMSNWLGVLVAAFAAVDLSLVWQSQQARMYSMLMLVMLLGLTQIVCIAEGNGRQRWRWILLGIIMGLGMWTHLSSVVLAMGTIVLAILLVRKNRNSPDSDKKIEKQIVIWAAISIGIVLLMSSPALMRLADFAKRESITSSNLRSLPGHISFLMRELSGRIEFTILLFILMTAGLINLSKWAPSRKQVGIVLLAVAVLAVLNLAIAATRHPINGARYLTCAMPSIWIGVGWLVLLALQNHRKWLRPAVAFLLVAYLGFQAYRCRQAQTITGTHKLATEFAQASYWVRRQVLAGAQLVSAPPIPKLTREYYRLRITPYMESEVKGLLIATPEDLAKHLPARRAKWSKKPTFLLATSPIDYQLRDSLFDPHKMLAGLGMIYQTKVDSSFLPTKRPVQLYIFKFSGRSMTIYRYKNGKIVAWRPPATKPAAAATTKGS